MTCAASDTGQLRVRQRIWTLSTASPHIAYRRHRELPYRRLITRMPNIIGDSAHTKRNLSAECELILDTLVQVRQQRPDAVLRLVGPRLGSDDELARRARANRLSTCVEFIGPVDHDAIPLHLSQLDVFTCLSLEEANSGNICEAMYVGLPILGGLRSGGAPWTPDGGRYGFSVVTGHLHAYAKAIREQQAERGRLYNLVDRPQTRWIA